MIELDQLTGQQRRVLKWAQLHGTVCTDDFMEPNVCDGGSKITRVPARIGELIDLGLGFERDGTRDGFAVWSYTADPVAVVREEAEEPMYTHERGLTVVAPRVGLVIEIVDASPEWLEEAISIVEASAAEHERRAA